MRSLLQNSIAKIAFVATIVLGLNSVDAKADNFRTSSSLTNATKNWNDGTAWQVEMAPNNWQNAGARFPSFNDNVTIGQGNTIILTDVTQCKSLTIDAPIDNNTKTLLNVGAMNLRVYGILSLIDGNGNRLTELSVTTGLVEVTGNIIVGNTSITSFPSSVTVGNSKVTKGATAIIEPNKTGIAPLPVELTYFTAVKKSSEVALTWETASEKNNTGFEVQSSTDGRNYEAVGFVATQNGNASNVQRYAFTHKTGSKEGLVYYRLKQIDLDGSFEYYTAKVVDLGRFTNAANVYPNPFQNQFQVNLQATAQETAQILVTDMTGKVVYTTSQEVQKGANTLNVTLENVPAGLYLLKATAGEQTYINRLVKQ